MIYYNLTNQAGMLSALAFWTDTIRRMARKLTHSARATARSVFAKPPNISHKYDDYTIKLTNTAGMFSSLPKRANAGPL